MVGRSFPSSTDRRMHCELNDDLRASPVELPTDLRTISLRKPELVLPQGDSLQKGLQERMPGVREGKTRTVMPSRSYSLGMESWYVSNGSSESRLTPSSEAAAVPHRRHGTRAAMRRAPILVTPQTTPPVHGGSRQVPLRAHIPLFRSCRVRIMEAP